jgi:hypothetical protein
VQAAAAPAGPFLLAQLLSWRTDMLTELGKRNDAATQRKRVRCLGTHGGMCIALRLRHPARLWAPSTADSTSCSLKNVRASSPLPLLLPQLTIEALFLEATGRLVAAAPATLAPQQGTDLEAVAFDWLLGADAYLAFPDPYRHKDRVRWRRSVADAELRSAAHAVLRAHACCLAATRRLL